MRNSLFYAFFPDRGIDCSRDCLYVKVLLIEHELIHSFKIDEQYVSDVGVELEFVRYCSVRGLKDVMMLTNLDGFFETFIVSGHNHASRKPGHYAFMSLAVFISSGAASAPLRITESSEI